MSKLLLIDGNGLLYRSYHAFPKELTAPSGELIGAVYGFARILLNTLKTLKPDCVAVCFDMKGPTFRNALFDAYKATRQKMPEDLAAQITRVKQIVEYLEMPIYQSEGFEADDVIGTLSTQAAEAGDQVVILTGDQDILQLVTEQIHVYMPASPPKQPTLYTPAAVQERYGFAPIQMVEYKALRGDPSDNIPGVPGVGEVTATKLVQEFGTIDKLYEALKGETPTIKPGIRQKLLSEEPSARLSHDLATIRHNAPVTLDQVACQVSLSNPEQLIDLFKELGFKSLLRDLPVNQQLIAQAVDVFTSTESVTPLAANSRSEQIDERLQPVLRSMEALGVTLDVDYLHKLQQEFEGELEARRQEIYQLAGEEFNLGSPSQVGHVLYEVLNIPTQWIRKGKTGFTTDASTLQGLAKEYPIAQLLLQFRELDKLQNTYIIPLQAITDEQSRVHTTYAPDTATGRLSSRNPNLQNIPVKTGQGRRIRRAFIAKPGWQLLAADYSQMELRVAAHLSGDEAMREVFRQNGDFHDETAKKMGVDRRMAKILNFSILYGKGAFGFAQDFGVSVAEAKQYIEQYFQTYSGLRRYLDEVLQSGREQGYVESMYGRRRAFPNLTSTNFQLRSAAEREAVNMPIQGTQADILKDAMCTLDETLRTGKLESRMILTVHDELVLEVPDTELKRVAPILEKTMIEAAELSVPVVVSVKSGRNWAELLPYAASASAA